MSPVTCLQVALARAHTAPTKPVQALPTLVTDEISARKVLKEFFGEPDLMTGRYNFMDPNRKRPEGLHELRLVMEATQLTMKLESAGMGDGQQIVMEPDGSFRAGQMVHYGQPLHRKYPRILPLDKLDLASGLEERATLAVHEKNMEEKKKLAEFVRGGGTLAQRERNFRALGLFEEPASNSSVGKNKPMSAKAKGAKKAPASSMKAIGMASGAARAVAGVVVAEPVHEPNSLLTEAVLEKEATQRRDWLSQYVASLTTEFEAAAACK